MAFTSKNQRKQKDIIQLVIAVVVLVLINFITNAKFFRLDLTTEKRYTLSASTKKLLSELDDVVYVQVYLEGDDFPAGFVRLRNATKEFLDEMRAYSKYIEYEFIDPLENANADTQKDIFNQLIKRGLKPTNLTVNKQNKQEQKIIFPAAIVNFQGKELPIQLLKSRMGMSAEEMLNISVQNLEYEISNAIRKIKQKEKPRIAFVQGHGELDELESYDIKNTLSDFYQVDTVHINENILALDGFKAIVIAKPNTEFTEGDKFVIDQFVMKGGKVLWCIDNVFASMDSLQNKDKFLAYAYQLNLEDQLFKYGVRINNNLLLDLDCATIPMVSGYVGEEPRFSPFPWYYFPLVVPKSSHPIVKNLDAIKFEFASSIDTIATPSIKKTILLTSGPYTRILNAPNTVNLRIARTNPQPEEFDRSHLPMAVLLEGKFTSVFKNRLRPTESNKDIKPLTESVDNKMIVIADGDILKNEVKRSSKQVLPLGYDRYTGIEYANKTFILNAMNYLLDDSGIIAVRAKEIKLRLLDKAKLKTEKEKYQLINIVLPNLLVIILGVVLTLIKRQKYK